MSTISSLKVTITSRELKVLKLASEGKPSHLIASKVNLPKGDVDISLKSVYAKLSTKNPLNAMQKLLKTDFEVED